MWTAFDYMYRDAGNFKAFGCVVFDRYLNRGDRQLIRSRLSSGAYFIAEQVGIPPLYEKLYEWSRGPTPADHCWHEFVGFRDVHVAKDRSSTISTREFVQKFAHLKDWDESLSSNFSFAVGF